MKICDIPDGDSLVIDNVAFSRRGTVRRRLLGPCCRFVTDGKQMLFSARTSGRDCKPTNGVERSWDLPW